ncbi:MAG TPA: deoxyribodipyrimidine photo-lyase [Solirubrobacteraceae bacterium]|nr:deoxyribodipyrimidine photo-lyase [Solirubrobacteraceae bacterium]
MTALLWLRRDLRVHDHPALEAARRDGDALVPVFCLDDRLLHGRHASGSRTQFLLECLADLDGSLRKRGSRLVVRHGRPDDELPRLAHEVGATAVHFSADVGPFARARDARVTRALDIPVREHPGTFVVDDLDAIRTGAGEPYTVFTPFHRTWTHVPRRERYGAPRELPALAKGVRTGSVPSLADLGLAQEVDDPRCRGGETAGRRALRDGEAPLSPYLHFGCLSAREVEDRAANDEVRRQLCWRDFFAHVLLHHPRNARSEHQARYRGTIRWSRAEKRFEAWREGLTGYPFVDAGMRQLKREGWIDNRTRLVVASFLTKDLGIDWRWGERWFMRLLLDGDEANNNGNWQWIASVGVDPQPVSRRILNPERQRSRFDPDGSYVRRYVPELRDGGRGYPKPIVDHARARRDALARYR